MKLNKLSSELFAKEVQYKRISEFTPDWLMHSGTTRNIPVPLHFLEQRNGRTVRVTPATERNVK